jgi:hypothetical protein
VATAQPSKVGEHTGSTWETNMNRSDFRLTLRKMAHPLVIGFALASFCSGASFALGTSSQRAACTPDVFRLCSSEIPNVDHIVACMNAKKASLSPACRAVFTPVSTR